VLQPAAAGLGIDLDATVSGLTGFTMNPLTIWAHLTGEQNQPLVLRVDRSKLTAAVTKVARALDRPLKEGSISFADGRATKVLPVTGAQVKAVRFNTHHIPEDTVTCTAPVLP